MNHTTFLLQSISAVASGTSQHNQQNSHYQPIRENIYSETISPLPQIWEYNAKIMWKTQIRRRQRMPAQVSLQTRQKKSRPKQEHHQILKIGAKGFLLKCQAAFASHFEGASLSEAKLNNNLPEDVFNMRALKWNKNMGKCICQPLKDTIMTQPSSPDFTTEWREESPPGILKKD